MSDTNFLAEGGRKEQQARIQSNVANGVADITGDWQPVKGDDYPNRYVVVFHASVYTLDPSCGAVTMFLCNEAKHFPLPQGQSNASILLTQNLGPAFRPGNLDPQRAGTALTTVGPVPPTFVPFNFLYPFPIRPGFFLRFSTNTQTVGGPPFPNVGTFFVVDINYYIQEIKVC